MHVGIFVAVSSRLVSYQTGHCNVSRCSSRVTLGNSQPESPQLWSESKNVQKLPLGKASTSFRLKQLDHRVPIGRRDLKHRLCTWSMSLETLNSAEMRPNKPRACRIHLLGSTAIWCMSSRRTSTGLQQLVLIASLPLKLDCFVFGLYD